MLSGQDLNPTVGVSGVCRDRGALEGGSLDLLAESWREAVHIRKTKVHWVQQELASGKPSDHIPSVSLPHERTRRNVPGFNSSDL